VVTAAIRAELFWGSCAGTTGKTAIAEGGKTGQKYICILTADSINLVMRCFFFLFFSPVSVRFPWASAQRQPPKMDDYLFWTHVAPAILPTKCLKIDVTAL
jgi:hypothetical protein